MAEIIYPIAAFVVAIIGAYFFGKQSAKNKATSDRLSSALESKKVKNEIEAMPDDAVLAEFDRLRDLRNKGGKLL